VGSRPWEAQRYTDDRETPRIAATSDKSSVERSNWVELCGALIFDIHRRVILARRFRASRSRSSAHPHDIRSLGPMRSTDSRTIASCLGSHVALHYSSSNYFADATPTLENGMRGFQAWWSRSQTRTLTQSDTLTTRFDPTLRVSLNLCVSSEHLLPASTIETGNVERPGRLRSQLAVTFG
jgi:hypothetical protein